MERNSNDVHRWPLGRRMPARHSVNQLHRNRNAVVKASYAALEVRGLGKKAMADRINTSRSKLDRNLDETDTSVTLESLSKAAQAVGCRVKIELEPP